MAVDRFWVVVGVTCIFSLSVSVCACAFVFFVVLSALNFGFKGVSRLAFASVKRKRKRQPVPTAVSQARDRYGNAIRSGGLDGGFSLEMECPYSAAITDRGDGSYDLRFTPQAAGAFAARMKYMGITLAAGAFDFVVLSREELRKAQAALRSRKLELTGFLRATGSEAEPYAGDIATASVAGPVAAPKPASRSRGTPFLCLGC